MCVCCACLGQILIQRDEESRDKHPVLFYKKLPPSIATMQVRAVITCILSRVAT